MVDSIYEGKFEAQVSFYAIGSNLLLILTVRIAHDFILNHTLEWKTNFTIEYRMAKLVQRNLSTMF